MKTYVPESVLEIILAHGAKSQPLDPELRELGMIVQQDAHDAVHREMDAARRKGY